MCRYLPQTTNTNDFNGKNGVCTYAHIDDLRENERHANSGRTRKIKDEKSETYMQDFLHQITGGNR